MAAPDSRTRILSGSKMTYVKSKLGGVTSSRKERLSGCVKLLLLWVAASDGNIDESEQEFAETRFPDVDGSVKTSDLLAAIRKPDLGLFETAIQAVAEESRELRSSFLDLAITMSMADHQIAITENHILRFYADALYLGVGILEKRFQTLCGTVYIAPDDPSDPAWWEQSGHNSHETDQRIVSSADRDFGNQTNKNQQPPRMTSEQARAVLGVSSEASQAELEKAHQDLTSIFQVQRFESMGEAAVSVISNRLKKINEAYELLGGDRQ